MNKLTESLEYLDMENQISDKITIDEYAAKVGKDSDIVTITFMVNSKLAGEDLVSWFERGYDFVLDASLSDGEISPGKYLVFVEMNRRSTVPARICLLLSDLTTLTGIKLKDWTLDIKNEEFEASEEIIKQKLILNPAEYRQQEEEIKEQEENKEISEELNLIKSRSGIPVTSTYTNDEYIKNLKAMAGM